MELAAWVLRVEGFVVGGLLERVLVGCLLWWPVRGGVEWGWCLRGGVARRSDVGLARWVGARTP